MRAQISTEYVMVTAFLLVVAGVIFGFALFSFNENARLAQANEAVTKIANYSNLVASLGDGSRIYFEITLPDGVRSLRVVNKAVNMRLATNSGDSDIYSYAKVNLTGQPSVYLPCKAGRKSLSATFQDGNVVLDANLSSAEVC